MDKTRFGHGAILLRLLQAVSFMGILKSVNLLFQFFALEKFQTDLEKILFKIKRLNLCAFNKSKGRAFQPDSIFRFGQRFSNEILFGMNLMFHDVFFFAACLPSSRNQPYANACITKSTVKA